MNFLRGMDIPGNGINAKAIRLLTEEFKSPEIYFGAGVGDNYWGRFELNETITITEKDLTGKTWEVDISYGRIELEYANHKFYRKYSIFGHWKKGYYDSDLTVSISRRAHRIELWRSGQNRVLFDEEVERFRQAFLSDDPIVHDQIHAAILEAVRT